MDNLKTAALMAGLLALLTAAGQMLGGTSGLILGQAMAMAG